uniref:TORTIFOLIA1/SINE1-2 N-terminal domain-containing protein n=2 Tax=Rhizophora mucronata TaxID=61149 RepID=A0A2P2L6X4_RHIMU
MVRNLSPTLCRELVNLYKDADSHKFAMNVLKSYVKELDLEAIPLFLAQVSETKETGSLSREYTISLYEVLACVHGVNIVPHIDRIMATIINALASNTGSFPLQQACSKVVLAIARYGIDPTSPEDKKRHIIYSLCRPLSEALLSSQECLTSGAALCLKALVDFDNWKFATDKMVNRVCQNVTVALEDKSTQSNSHMKLIMSLAKHNALIVEAYARLLIQSGLCILNDGVVEKNSQKQLSAIQMVNFLMKCLDHRSILSQLDLIIEEMDKCQSDQMAYVSGAAFEALQTAKKIAADKGSKLAKSCGSVIGPNFSGREQRMRRNLSVGSDQSTASLSPGSHVLDYFMENNAFVGSPISITHVSPNTHYAHRSVNQKLRSYENGGVDVSVKDGLFSEIVQGKPMNISFSDHSGHYKHAENGGDYAGEVAGFLQRSPINGQLRSAAPSSQRLHSCMDAGKVNDFTNPRKLICCLQDPRDVKSDFSETQSIRLESSCSTEFNYSPSTRYSQNGLHNNAGYEVRHNRNLRAAGDQFECASESVSSTDDIVVNGGVQVSPDVSHGINCGSPNNCIKKSRWKISSGVIAVLFVLLAIFASLMENHNVDGGPHLVPT